MGWQSPPPGFKPLPTWAAGCLLLLMAVAVCAIIGFMVAQVGLLETLPFLGK